MTDKHRFQVLKIQYADLLDRYVIAVDALEHISTETDDIAIDSIDVARRALLRIREIVTNENS